MYILVSSLVQDPAACVPLPVFSSDELGLSFLKFIRFSVSLSYVDCFLAVILSLELFLEEVLAQAGGHTDSL